jgi:HEAT repeat protein
MPKKPLLCLVALLLPATASARKAFDTEAATGNEIIEYLSHGSWEYRYDAAGEVKARCIVEAEKKLAEMAEQDENNRVRRAALEALQHCRMPSAVAAAEAVALVDADVDVRGKALGIIEASGSARSAPVLGQAVVGDPDAGLRKKAAEILRKRAWKGAEASLEKGTADPDRDVRLASLFALQAVGSPKASGLILGALKDADVEVRREVIRRMEEAPRAEWKDGMVSALDDGDEYVARHAARALVRLGDRSVAKTLREKALGAPRKVAEEFAEAAANLGG